MAILFTKFVVLFSFYTSCKSEMEPFIIGGGYVKIERFPHSIYLLVSSDGLSFMCGGSIVNQRIFLTAAHCLDTCTNDWTVRAHAGSERVSEMRYLRNVNKYIIHHAYNERRTLNDIALGYMSKSLPLGRTCSRVILKRSFPKTTFAEIAGWGLIDDHTEEEPDVLKAVKQDLQPKRVCNKLGHLAKGVMCATNSIRNRPTKGDSGSALMIPPGQQIGLVSFRHPQDKELIMYTNVSYYYDWILDCAKKLYCSDRRHQKHNDY